MSFDPRQPHARLLVDGSFGKQHAVFALDTGAASHVVSLGFARAAHCKRGAKSYALDAYGQTHDAQSIAGAIDVPGVVEPVAPLIASDLMELLDSDGDRPSGILCPQLMVIGDDALVIDIPRGRMEQRSRRDAFAASSDRALLLADVSIGSDQKFDVAATIGGREVVLEIDTGAPKSTLFVLPNGKMPDGAFGRSSDRGRLEVGQVRRELAFDVLTASDRNIGGLLGLDVLRDCTLAISSSRLRITCDDKPDLGAAVAPNNAAPSVDICFGTQGPCLRELAAGDFAYVVDGEAVGRIDRRGRVKLFKKAHDTHARTTREEREWLKDATRGLRAQLDRNESMRTSFEFLPRLVHWVWTRYGGSMADRRALLFRLWAGCADASEPDRAGAGERARRVITAFVREVAPVGSPDAYTKDELDVLNAGREHRFEPYTPEAIDVP